MAHAVQSIAFLWVCVTIFSPALLYCAIGCYAMYNISDHHAKNRIQMRLWISGAFLLALSSICLFFSAIGYLGYLAFS